MVDNPAEENIYPSIEVYTTGQEVCLANRTAGEQVTIEHSIAENQKLVVDLKDVSAFLYQRDGSGDYQMQEDVSHWMSLDSVPWALRPGRNQVAITNDQPEDTPGGVPAVPDSQPGGVSMPEIRIYDPPNVEAPTFRPLGLVLAATDVTLIERHWSPGSFTLSVPLGARHEDRLTGGRLLLVDGTFWGIIDGFTLEASSSGYVRTVSGRQLKGLTLDRITIPPESTEVTGAQGYDAVTGSTETIMKHFVTANMAAPVLAARKVFGLEVAADQGRGLAEDKYMSRHDVVSDVLAALGKLRGWGTTSYRT